MKILHVISSINPESGGPIEGILQQNAALARYGVTREAVTVDLPTADYLLKIPFPVHALGVTPGVGAGTYSARRFGYSPKLIPWLRENASKYDCVIVNGVWNYASFSASMTLRRGTTPYFVFTHGMLDPWFRKQSWLKHLFKQVSWLISEGPLLKSARAVLFTSEEERRIARGSFWGFSGYVERVAKYGIAPPRSDLQIQIDAFRRRTPELENRKFLLFLSRIHPKKGCDILIDAFARIADRYPDLDLVVAGPDQLGWKSELESNVSKLGLGKRVHWPGMLVGAEKWGGYRSTRALLLPSHGENFGIVVAEALSCGAPVLISNKVNIWREIAAGDAGLVGDNTVEAFTVILEKFLEMSEAEHVHMCECAIKVYNEYYNLENTGLELLELLKS